MKGAAAILLYACVTMVRAIPMESSEVKDPSMMMTMMTMLGGDKKCHDPFPMFVEMYSMICDTNNCAVNVPKCAAVMMPPSNICDMQKECMQAMHSKKEQPSIKVMMECLCEKMMTSMNLTYVKDDIKGNTVKMLELSMSKSKDIPDKTKTAVMTAAKDTCPTPPADYMIMDQMKYGICIMKTCVKSMAS